MLSVSEALDRLLSAVHPLTTEAVPLSKCVERVLAQDIVADTDLPPFHNSSMDGFAVRASDVRSASPSHPVTLKIVGDIPAAVEVNTPLKPEEAMRIMTGAPLPPESDAVVPVEKTSEPGALVGKPLPKRIQVLSVVAPGDHVRKPGQDVQAGTMVLQKGTRLRPQDIGMLAALGLARPIVYRRPVVAILSTGDELLEVDQPLTPGRIRDANGYALVAAVQAIGAIPNRLGIAPDDTATVVERFDQAVSQKADLIISSAGVSMGAFDFVRSAVEAHGDLAFWRVNIRPGKPLVFGSYRDVPFLGLPGNPVSALVTFEVFVRPTISRLSGREGRDHLKVVARLDHAIRSDGRESYLRARLRWEEGEYRASLTGTQDSGVLSSLVVANALVIVPPGVKLVGQGETLESWILHSTSIPSVSSPSLVSEEGDQ